MGAKRKQYTQEFKDSAVKQGANGFIDELEQTLGRVLRRQKPGPKPAGESWIYCPLNSLEFLILTSLRVGWELDMEKYISFCICLQGTTVKHKNRKDYRTISSVESWRA